MLENAEWRRRGHASLRDFREPLAELAHPQALVIGLGEVHQDLVVVEGQPGVLLEGLDQRFTECGRGGPEPSADPVERQERRRRLTEALAGG